MHYSSLVIQGGDSFPFDDVPMQASIHQMNTPSLSPSLRHSFQEKRRHTMEECVVSRFGICLPAEIRHLSTSASVPYVTQLSLCCPAMSDLPASLRVRNWTNQVELSFWHHTLNACCHPVPTPSVQSQNIFQPIFYSLTSRVTPSDTINSGTLLKILKSFSFHF